MGHLINKRPLSSDFYSQSHCQAFFLHGFSLRLLACGVALQECGPHLRSQGEQSCGISELFKPKHHPGVVNLWFTLIGHVGYTLHKIHYENEPKLGKYGFHMPCVDDMWFVGCSQPQMNGNSFPIVRSDGAPECPKFCWLILVSLGFSYLYPMTDPFSK